MIKQEQRPGITLLLFAVLISSGMLLGLGVWKATSYFVDFALEKERYQQSASCVEGVMRYVVRSLEHDSWERMQPVTRTIQGWPCVLERFKGVNVTIAVSPAGAQQLSVNVTLTRERAPIAHGSCHVVRYVHGNDVVLVTRAWNIVIG